MSCSGFGLISLLKNNYKEKIFGLEIGCYAGENAAFLLENIEKLYLYGVDPYKEYIDWNGGLTLHNEDNAEFIAKQRLEPFKERFIFFRETSDNAVNKFENDFFDFVFIDGLHTYEQVLKDCKNYYAKLKPGGIFSGHDYGAIIEVKKAVDEFSETVNKTVLRMETDSWYWIK